ncbi:hypothetical protein LOD99_6696 [Oopsacas minuta]|uniref:Polymerase nucleotidyl transferase domain-containing protein n=1 Tax=Oopsacas minuta TaxID=111878 RepID=A0AAV7JKV8_9METZ|nr:hypothetical protein LOD99_6696 [Oopsacas minuta]
MASLLTQATNAIHQQDRLLRIMKQYEQEGTGQVKSQIILEGYSILDSLKDQKSKLEGTFSVYNPFPLDSELLDKFRWDVRAHTPSSVPKEFKGRIVDGLSQCFGAFWKKPIFSCLLTCPLFASVHSETSSQAARNILFVVYVGLDEHFFTLLTQSEREQHEVIDRDFVVAVEVRHFCNQIKSGNVRFLEALFCPLESVILSSPEFDCLRGKLKQSEFTTVVFAKRCLGQAYGSVAKYRKDLKIFTLKEDATMEKLFHSYRLIYQVYCVTEGMPLLTWRDFEKEPVSPNDPPLLGEILDKIRCCFRAEISRETVLTHQLTLKDQIESRVSTLPLSATDPLLKSWLADLRRQDSLITPPQSPCPSALKFLSSVAEQVGPKLAKIDPKHILILTRCGSYSYGLNLPSSDTDYLIVFTTPAEEYLSSFSAPEETIEKRGKEVEIEFCAYELRLFIHQLLKGSIPIFELLLNDQLDYFTPLWEELRANRHKLVTEKLLVQFFGFIKDHLLPIRKGKYAEDAKKQQKLFYQAFHKLGLLETLMAGEIPPLRPEGEARELIMRIRRGPLEGELSKDRLFEIADKRLAKLDEDLISRKTRFPEIGDRDFLLKWSLKVRGFQRLNY